MGLFDLFKSNKGEGKPRGNADRWAEKATDKRAQVHDRQQAIEELAKMGTGEAAAILLKRFTFTIDPSITDQEEKEFAFEGILAAGAEAVTAARAFATKAESVTWPLKVMKSLLDEEAYLGEVLGLLAKWDTEYAKFVEPKLQLLAVLEDHEDPRIAPAVLPFLEDVNETARYHAAVTLLAQKDPSAVAPLLDMFENEESLRVQNRVADGFSRLGWTVPADRLDAIRKVLPEQWRLDGDGNFQQ